MQEGIDFAANFWDYASPQSSSAFTDAERTLITSVASVFQPNLLAHEAFYSAQIASGHNVIVVAHSQGNLYVNQAYDAETGLGANPALFHIIAVATPAHAVADSGPHFTFVWRYYYVYRHSHASKH